MGEPAVCFKRQEEQKRLCETVSLSYIKSTQLQMEQVQKEVHNTLDVSVKQGSMKHFKSLSFTPPLVLVSSDALLQYLTTCSLLQNLLQLPAPGAFPVKLQFLLPHLIPLWRELSKYSE